jgi:hypothetical protein
VIRITRHPAASSLVAGAVALEGVCGRVAGVAVELDDQALLGPTQSTS